jgi:hypothetical protein
LKVKFEENQSVQTKTSRNPENGSEKIMKENLKNCMLKEKFGNHMVELRYVGVFFLCK